MNTFRVGHIGYMFVMFKTDILWLQGISLIDIFSHSARPSKIVRSRTTLILKSFWPCWNSTTTRLFLDERFLPAKSRGQCPLSSSLPRPALPPPHQPPPALLPPPLSLLMYAANGHNTHTHTYSTKTKSHSQCSDFINIYVLHWI